MSKTFRQLRAGDEVYVIKGSNVEITKVSTAEPSPTEKHYTWVVFDDYEYSVYSDSTSFYDDMVGDIYCDIDEAMRKMQALQGVRQDLRHDERACGGLWLKRAGA